MTKRKYPPEVREQAVMLAAGQSTTVAAEALQIPTRTIQYWKDATDPATLARYIAQKRELATRAVLNNVEAASNRIMSRLLEVPLETAKDLQAASVSLGIMDDHYGGRQNPNSSMRFGTRDSLLDGWTEHDRVTLERIERVVIEPDQPPRQEG